MITSIEQFFRGAANHFGYSLQKRKASDTYALSFAHFLEMYVVQNPNSTTFIEIGANDGVTNDPLYDLIKKYDLRGTVCEPQADVFSVLEKNYEGTEVLCLNVAIGEEAGTKTLYTVKDSHKSVDNFRRVTGIATFDKPTLMHTILNKIPKGADPEDYIDETPVPCVTLAELGHADIIQIDCEGYDYHIVKQIDFSKKPAIINYESGHLSDAERAACYSLFTKHGYQWFTHGIDTCAYLIVRA